MDKNTKAVKPGKRRWFPDSHGRVLISPVYSVTTPELMSFGSIYVQFSRTPTYVVTGSSLNSAVSASPFTLWV